MDIRPDKVQRGQQLSPKGIEARLHADATLDGLYYDVHGPYSPRCTICDDLIPTRSQNMCRACAEDLPPVLTGQGEYEHGYAPKPVYWRPSVLQWIFIFAVIWAVVLAVFWLCSNRDSLSAGHWWKGDNHRVAGLRNITAALVCCERGAIHAGGFSFSRSIPRQHQAASGTCVPAARSS